MAQTDDSIQKDVLIQTLAENVNMIDFQHKTLEKQVQQIKENHALDKIKIIREFIESDLFKRKFIKKPIVDTQLSIHPLIFPPSTNRHTDDHHPILSPQHQLSDIKNENVKLRDELNVLKHNIQTGCLVYKDSLHQHPMIIKLTTEIERYKTYIKSLKLAINTANNNLDNTDDDNLKREHLNNEPVALPSVIMEDKSIISLKSKTTCLSLGSSSDSNQLKAKYKIINIPKLDPKQLLEDLKTGNPSIEFLDIDKIYKVNGNHATYLNAIMNISSYTSNNLGKKFSIYINQKKKHVYEFTSIKQCTLCWSYDHTKTKCDSSKHCKNCSSDQCSGKGCLKFCRLCHLSREPYNHRVGSYECSTFKIRCNNQKTDPRQHGLSQHNSPNLSSSNLGPLIVDHKPNKKTKKKQTKYVQFSTLT